MTLPYPIAPSQTDAKSPVDDTLMDSIRLDLDDLDSRLGVNAPFPYEWRINGPIPGLVVGNKIVRLDGLHIVKSALTVTKARAELEFPGSSGSLIVDIRKYKAPNTPITSIARQYSAAIQSINQIAPAHSTQTIARSTAQISTQSISQWKTSINISSILKSTGAKMRLNLASAPDSDWKVGDTVTVASATNANNNGDFVILQVNEDGAANVIVTNAAAVDQAGAVGNVTLRAYSYNFSNPVSTQFAALDKFLAAAHSTGANNGSFTIYAINSGGNNIVIKNAAGVVQAGVAGTADVYRWSYTFLVSPDAAFVAGETAVMTTHTTGANNGTFLITGIGAASVTVYNESGAVQGSAAGVVNTNRWIFGLPTDPTASFTVGQTFKSTGTTSLLNAGTFTVVQINRSATNNLVVHNSVGLAQGAVVGTLDHTRIIYSFLSDQSTIYSVAGGSRLETFGCVDSRNNGFFDVVEVNRGGGANYNVVVESVNGAVQIAAGGRVISESRSILSAFLTMTLATDQYNTTDRHLQYVETSSFNSNAVFNDGDRMGCEIRGVPSGNPSDLVIQAS